MVRHGALRRTAVRTIQHEQQHISHPEVFGAFRQLPKTSYTIEVRSSADVHPKPLQGHTEEAKTYRSCNGESNRIK